MEATPRNMERLRERANQAIAAPGVFAYSPETGERYTASPGDYFMQSPDEPLKDEEGNPMILATEVIEIRPLTDPPKASA